MMQTTKLIDKRKGFKILRLEQAVLAPNYRTNFSMPDISSLAESIREVGQLQPVIINKIGAQYYLIAGQRRYYAVAHAKLERIKCMIYNDLTEEEVAKIQLSENIKQPIGVLGRAESIPRAMQKVQDYQGRSISSSEFARMTNLAKTTVCDAHHYANLCEEAKNAVEEGRITYAMGAQIGRLEKAQQAQLLLRALRGDFKNAKEMGHHVSELKKSKEAPATLELMVQETDTDFYIREKAKDYSVALKQTASYIESLFIILQKEKDARQAINDAKLNHWTLGELVQSISSKLSSLEEKIREHNEEALEQALHPKKKEDILKLILRERRLNQKGETAADLIRNAQEAEISLNKIYRDKHQPRRTNAPEYKHYIHTLSNNIKEMGVLTPIIIVKRKSEEGNYRIVVGESRWRASKKAGLKKIPALIVELDDLSCYIIQLAEDLHRKDSPVERAQAISTLAEQKKKLKAYSREEFRKDMEAFMGMKPGEVRKYMNFLELDNRTKQLVYNKTLGFSSALELGRIKEYEQRRELANTIIAQSISTAGVKKLIAETLQNMQWYSHIRGKEKEFLAQFRSACQGRVESKILEDTIKCLVGLESMLTKLPEQEKFYRQDALAKSYASLKRAIDNYNGIMRQ